MEANANVSGRLLVFADPVVVARTAAEFVAIGETPDLERDFLLALFTSATSRRVFAREEFVQPLGRSGFSCSALAEAKGLEGSKCWFEVAHPMDQPTKLMRAVAWAAVVAPLAIAFEARVVEAPLVKFRSAWTQVDEPAEALLRRNQRRLLVEHREGLEALRSLSSAGVAEECLVAVFDEGCQFVLWDPRM